MHGEMGVEGRVVGKVGLHWRRVRGWAWGWSWVPVRWEEERALVAVAVTSWGRHGCVVEVGCCIVTRAGVGC